MLKKLGIINILEIFGILGALVFSYLAYVQSNEAINISEVQTNFMKSEKNPIIKIKMDYIFEENTTKEIFSKINIFNDGEKIRNYQISSYSFLYISSCRENQGCNDFYLPIQNIIISFFSKDATEGNLGRLFYSLHDYIRYKSWVRKIYRADKTKEKDGIDYLDVSLQLLVDVGYENLHNEKKHNFFKLDFDMGRSYQIEENVFKKLTNLWEKSREIKEFDSFTYMDLKQKSIKR